MFNTAVGRSAAASLIIEQLIIEFLTAAMLGILTSSYMAAKSAGHFISNKHRTA